jgi:hypothetical protein
MIKGGATLPEDEWATIGWNDHTSAKPKPSLLDVTLILQSPTEPKGWGMNPYDQGLRIDEQSAGAPVWSPGGMPVPAPGALVMLGLAGLCGGRRRR